MANQYIVQVMFSNNRIESPKLYDYYTDMEYLVKGDLVVVDTQYGYNCASVEGYIEQSDKAGKWIVARVDLTAHQERRAKSERMKALEKELERRMKEEERLRIYRETAKSSPEMQALLEEYERLS